MPKVGDVSGAKVYIHMGDHEPPHVHVVYQGQRAKLDLATGWVAAGQLPSRILSDVRSWITERQPQLQTEWQRMRKGQTPTYIR